jgi:hypothetical protein
MPAAEAVAGWVRGLTDEKLGRSGPYVADGPVWTVDRWIERVLIGHPGRHLDDIRAPLGVAGVPP